VRSRVFTVRHWSGVTVEDIRVEPDGRASFAVGPRGDVGPIDYPDSYESPMRFIKNERTAIADPADPTQVEWFCFTCTFRPWLDAGDARSAYFVIDGKRVAASEQDGRWYSARPLAAGESARVPAGAVRDAFGNRNGAASATVTR
jgi:hypothetical protein